MILEAEKLPDNVPELRTMLLSLAAHHTEQEQEYQKKIDLLYEQIRHLRSKLFGRKTEKYVDSGEEQLQLFDEIEQADPSTEENKQEVAVASYTRKKTGRKPLPDHLPRVEVIHDLPEEEKVCACGCRLTKIDEEISEKLDYIPAKLQVIRHIRYKYACKGCEGVDSDGGAVKIAPAPVQIIPKGIATPGLLSQILVSKFCDALPFYRQEKIFARLDIDLPRATMANWAIKVFEQCRPLMEILRSEILAGPLVNIDKTTVQVLNEPGRADTTQSYIIHVDFSGRPAR